MFWTCSRICSIKTLSSTAAWETSMSTAWRIERAGVTSGAARGSSRAIGKPAKLPLVSPETEAATQAMLQACLRH